MADNENGVFISLSEIYGVLVGVRDDVRDLHSESRERDKDLAELRVTVTEQGKQIDKLRARTLAFPATMIVGVLGLLVYGASFLMHLV